MNLQTMTNQTKNKLNTQLGEAAGLAKECSAAIIAEGTYPADYPSAKTNTNLTIGGNCNGGTTAPAPATSVTYTTIAATANPGRSADQARWQAANSAR